MQKRTLKRWLAIAVALLIIAAIYQYMRPVPAVPAAAQLPVAPKTQAVALPWPAQGQAALGAVGYGLLDQINDAMPAPIGSTAKIITALAVLKQKPITDGGQGPVITLSSQDVAFFNTYYSQDGSVTQVTNGEQITEFQALESLLLPSSNNMADSLAIWAFGSIDAYLTYANQMVTQMGLKNTKVGDTNGFSDTTTSTASDLVKIGLAATANPVVATIVSQTSAQVPVAGTIKNLNFLLGEDGVTGIKTGYTQKAGGCYLFAAKNTIAGHNITLVGAVLNQTSLADAINAALSILAAGDSGFQPLTIIHRNQALGSYRAPWGATATYAASKDLSLLVWKGAEIKISSQLDAIKPAKAGFVNGQIVVSNLNQSASSPLRLNQNLPPSSPLWRILR